MATMHPETWQLLDQALGEPPLLRAGEGASTEEIEKAVARLGFPFPPDYVEFLRRVGGAMVGPYPVYGLRSSEVMASEDVVSVTTSYRENWKVPFEALVVSVDHGGNPFLLWPSGRVTRPDHELGGADVIANDFEGFLLYCLGGTQA